MNRLKLTVTVPSNVDHRLMYYTVTAGTSHIIFTGKVFVKALQTQVTFDLTDIVNNYTYRGAGILTPTWQNGYFEGGGYMQPYAGSNNSASLHVTELDETGEEFNVMNITLRVYSDKTLNTLVTSLTKANVYFHSIAPYDTYLPQEAGSGTNTFRYYFDTNLIPRLPKVATTNLCYGQMIYGYGQNVNFYNSANATVATSPFNYNTKVLNMDLHTLLSRYTFADNKLYIGSTTSNKVPALQFDVCPKPFYLLWLNSRGGFQSYGFEKTTEYVENYANNFRYTVDNQKYKANQTLTSKWKMKSGLVNEKQYDCIIQAARSPYCILYLTEFDRVYYVNVVDTKLEHKNRYNQKGKLFNAEFEVEVSDSEFEII